MERIVVIKIYSNGRLVRITGEKREKEDVEEAVKRLIKEKGLKNRGNFVVLYDYGHGAFLIEYPNRVDKHKAIHVWLSEGVLKEICREVSSECQERI